FDFGGVAVDRKAVRRNHVFAIPGLPNLNSKSERLDAAECKHRENYERYEDGNLAGHIDPPLRDRVRKAGFKAIAYRPTLPLQPQPVKNAHSSCLGGCPGGKNTTLRRGSVLPGGGIAMTQREERTDNNRNRGPDYRIPGPRY